MKPLHALLALMAVIALAQTVAYSDEFTDDPVPEAHGGMGCITDSECEGIEAPCNDEDCPPDTEHDGTLYS